MRPTPPVLAIALLAGLALPAMTQSARAETPAVAVADLPDSPAPQSAQPAPGAAQASQSSSSTQTAPVPVAAQTPQKSQRELAAEQLKKEEQQRVLGVVPNFNISYDSNAASLSAGQKMQLAFRSTIDPFTFAAANLVAGLHEGLNEDPGFGWGPEGYGKRAGAAYLDAFTGTIIGNGILPSIFHQDPRYFRLGHGSVGHRLLYAIGTTYICKHDNSGRWEPNYSNVGGNIISGALSNYYYPSSNSGWGQTITNGFIVTSEGTIGGVFDEFWPDISRKLFHKDPTHGQDAMVAATHPKQKPVE
jgi:hypothetical protein